MRRLLYALVVGLSLALAPSSHSANTHGLPDAASEQQAILADFLAPYVASGCLPAVPAASLTLGAFACKAYVLDGVQLAYVDQAAAGVGPLNAGDGTYFVAVRRARQGASGPWVAESLSNYLWQKATSKPPPPPGGLVIAQLTVSGGAVTAVQDLRCLDPLACNLGVVNVARYATGGDGSAVSPWTGWDTAIAWRAAAYHFAEGVYAYSTAPNWCIQGIRLRGVGQATLQYTGTGHALLFDGGATGEGRFDAEISALRIRGTTSTGRGLFVRACHHSTFRRLIFETVPGGVAECQFCVANVFDRIVYSINQTVMAAPAGSGLLITRRNPGDLQASSATSILDPIIEGVAGAGIEIDYGHRTYIRGGTSEGNTTYGLRLTSNASLTEVHSIDLEANGVEDLRVEGRYSSLHSIFVSALARVTASALGTTFTGGYVGDLLVDASGSANFFGLTTQHNPSFDRSTLVNDLGHFVVGTGGFLLPVLWASSTGSPFPWTQMAMAHQQDLMTIQTTPNTDSGIVVPAQTLVVAAVTRVAVVIPGGVATYKVSTLCPDSGYTNVEMQMNSVGVTNMLNVADGGMKAGILPACSVPYNIRISPNITPTATTGRVQLDLFYFQAQQNY